MKKWSTPVIEELNICETAANGKGSECPAGVVGGCQYPKYKNGSGCSSQCPLYVEVKLPDFQS